MDTYQATLLHDMAVLGDGGGGWCMSKINDENKRTKKRKKR